MAGVPSGLRKGLTIVALVTVSLGIHTAMATGRGIYLAGPLIVAEAGLIAWTALGLTRIRALQWIGCAAALVLTAAVWRYSKDGIVASSAIPHAVAYLSILTVFGTSLLPGRKAIATVFAEKARGELPPAILRYTRRVTWAWCGFCVAQLLGSFLLLLFAPAEIWSMFVNVLNLPLLLAMFCGEFAWRKWRHGTPGHLTDGFRMAGQIRTHDST